MVKPDDKFLGWLRAQFEEDLTLMSTLRREEPPKFDRHESAKGGSQHAYKDKKTQQLWRGYKLHHEMRHLTQWVAYEDRERPLGKYVVARLNGIGVPVFSRHPFRHTLRKEAVAEANRLGAESGARFAVFRCIEIGGQHPLATVGEQLQTISNIVTEFEQTDSD